MLMPDKTDPPFSQLIDNLARLPIMLALQNLRVCYQCKAQVRGGKCRRQISAKLQWKKASKSGGSFHSLCPVRARVERYSLSWVQDMSRPNPYLSINLLLCLWQIFLCCNLLAFGRINNPPAQAHLLPPPPPQHQSSKTS